MEEECKKLLEQVNLDLNPGAIVSNLTVAQQQMVEIAKAFSYNSRVLIMDEPTSALSDRETEQLFVLIEKMKKAGIAVIYISHRMDEIKRICDRATIMRDGQYVSTVDVSTTSIEEIIALMVGREVNYVRDEKNIREISSDIVLEVKDLNWGNKVKDVSFKLFRGEILGFAGLMGAGRTETARVIFGAEKCDSGSIFINGQEVKIRTCHDAVAHGISYLSEDRKRYGLMLPMSVEENISIASLDKLCSRFNIVDNDLCSQEAEKYKELLKIKTPGVYAKVMQLSGGNQQKVVIAKWLLKDNEILIFDEPTRGIDIGAKQEICELILDLAKKGKSIIVISSEMQELLRVCDRIVVMHEGVITGEVNAETTTQEEIMRLASKVTV